MFPYSRRPENPFPTEAKQDTVELMEEGQSTNKKFFAPLHGLRGIACLYVAVAHLGQYGLFLLPLPHDGIGKVGVWIFFSLSSFLLTTHLCRDLETTSSKVFSLLQYAVHRIFRHNGCQLKAKDLPLANMGYAVDEQFTTAQSHNQGGRS
jgi:hypothetical protein